MTRPTRHRILIVDDNPAIHEDFWKILTREEEESGAELDDLEAVLFAEPTPSTRAPRTYDVASAMRGEDALSLVKQSLVDDDRFAMAFVDMRMPSGWDGLETIEQLWRVDPDIQVVICTAYSDHGWEDILDRFGTSDRLLLLKKPFDIVEVCQLACALTEKWVLARQSHLKLCQLQGMVSEQTEKLVSINRRLEGEVVERRRSEEAARASEFRYALAAAGANDGLWDWDLAENRVYYSPRWKLMLGYSPGEIDPTPAAWFDCVHREDRPRLEAGLAAHLEGEEDKFWGEYRMATKDGRYRWMLCRGLAVRDPATGRAIRIAGSQTDITERKIAEEQLRHAASHDALTGLANRALLTHRLADCFRRRELAPETLFAVLFLDLDKFKIINDSLGHIVGDKLLVATAERLTRSLRATDTVAVPRNPWCLSRIGGDEFVVLLEGLRSPSDALVVAQRIHQCLEAPFDIDGHEVFTATSIGIATSDTSSESAEAMLRDADTALYRAKAAGSGGHATFDQTMHREAMTRWRIETDLRRGIERDELRLLYQPIIDIASGTILEAEALVRWEHPERGMISPLEFIPIAESTGLIVPLGYWVFRAACRQVVAWQTSHTLGSDFSVAVNVSAKQLALDPHFVDEIARILDETGVPRHRIRLEITESAMMGGTSALQILEKLRALGLRFHLDDFGTGYSSLSYLRRMPIDVLKIDQSFVRTMAQDPMSHSIVVAIVTLAHSLGMTVIAEGVETEADLAALRALHCEAAQGYLFDRPLEAAVMGERLARGAFALSA